MKRGFCFPSQQYIFLDVLTLTKYPIFILTAEKIREKKTENRKIRSCWIEGRKKKDSTVAVTRTTIFILEKKEEE
jgi:hypothetical protein